jgi:hypothetical protein
MYAAASFSVTIGRPFGGLIGSSKGRDQGTCLLSPHQMQGASMTVSKTEQRRAAVYARVGGERRHQPGAVLKRPQFDPLDWGRLKRKTPPTEVAQRA